MIKKKCPQCHRFSFRANDMNIWKCPFCKTDLQQVLPIEKKHKLRKGQFKHLK